MKFTRTLTALALVMGLGAAPAYADLFGLDEDEDEAIEDIGRVIPGDVTADEAFEDDPEPDEEP